jgi:hypothetical protein
MVETHEFKGLWWLPADEATKLSGTLKVTKGDAELELIGHFGHKLISKTETEESYSFSLEERPRIVGISTTGKRITLERHGVAAPTFHFPGIETSVYRLEVVLIGKTFAEEEEVAFDEVAIRASDLNTWTRVSGFDTKIGVEEQEETGLAIFSEVDIRFGTRTGVYLVACAAIGERVCLPRRSVPMIRTISGRLGNTEPRSMPGMPAATPSARTIRT